MLNGIKQMLTYYISDITIEKVTSYVGYEYGRYQDNFFNIFSGDDHVHIGHVDYIIHIHIYDNINQILRRKGISFCMLWFTS